MSFKVYKYIDNESELKASDETVPMFLSLKQIERLDHDGMLLPNVLTAIKEAAKK